MKRVLLTALGMMALTAVPAVGQQAVALAIDVQIPEIRKFAVELGDSEPVESNGYMVYDDAVTVLVTANTSWQLEVVGPAGEQVEARAEATAGVDVGSEYVAVNQGRQAIARGSRGRSIPVRLDLRSLGNLRPSDLRYRVVAR